MFANQSTILDFNRMFGLNAFGTGLPIPPTHDEIIADDENITNWLSSSLIRNLWDNPTPSPESSPSSGDVPDLTASPSTTSSTMSVALEDDHIRRLFPLNEYRPQRNQEYRSPSAVAQEGQKKELNPKAVSFVPSSPLCLHNPLAVPEHPYFQTLEPIDFLHEECFQQPQSPYVQSEASFPAYEDSPRHMFYGALVPQFPGPNFPPGLPHPPRVSRSDLNVETPCTTPPTCPEAPYTHIFRRALLPTTNDLQHKFYACAVVHSVSEWHIENLLELAEHFCHEAFNAEFLFDQSEYAKPACDEVRFTDARQKLQKRPTQREGSLESETIHEALAKIAQLTEKSLEEFHGKDVANCFAWTLRETVLKRFVFSWDTTKDSAISFGSIHYRIPTPYYVRASLSLSKFMAELYKVKLLTREHVFTCFRVLLDTLDCVERLEALALLVLGCGNSLWFPANLAPDAYMLPAGSSRRFDNNSHSTATGPEIEEQLGHIREFLLSDSLYYWAMCDQPTVLNQPWGTGQLQARVKEILSAVKQSEAKLQLTPMMPV
ncbi:hypothetical protein B0H34DRAFT_674886 [Crassisporium funariophilum]|nr:hypothetical protein B0H34DRAFT_674886 [Crassisporium funariophilum]